MISVLLGLCSGLTLAAPDASADEGEKTMMVVRIYTGPDNKSHFEELQIPLKDAGQDRISFRADEGKGRRVPRNHPGLQL
jgi:hypothetical protein